MWTQANKWQRWDSSPSSLTPEPVLLNLNILQTLPCTSTKAVFPLGMPSPQSQTSEVHSSSMQMSLPISVTFPNSPKLAAAFSVLSQHFARTSITALNLVLTHAFSSSCALAPSPVKCLHTGNVVYPLPQGRSGAYSHCSPHGTQHIVGAQLIFLSEMKLVKECFKKYL